MRQWPEETARGWSRSGGSAWGHQLNQTRAKLTRLSSTPLFQPALSVKYVHDMAHTTVYAFIKNILLNVDAKLMSKPQIWRRMEWKWEGGWRGREKLLQLKDVAGEYGKAQWEERGKAECQWAKQKRTEDEQWGERTRSGARKRKLHKGTVKRKCTNIQSCQCPSCADIPPLTLLVVMPDVTCSHSQ